MGQEKNGRNLGNLAIKEICRNLNNSNDTPLITSPNVNSFLNYSRSLFNLNPVNDFGKTMSTQTSSSLSRNPMYNNTNPFSSDRVPMLSRLDAPSLLGGKEDSAPDYLFNSY
jgi:hypothetical protein